MSKTKKRCISIIGLGYVGLPLAIAFGKAQKIIGFDVNSKKISEKNILKRWNCCEFNN